MRRRLRLPSSSDEEEGPIPLPQPPANADAPPHPVAPVLISDDDDDFFMDASSTFSPSHPAVPESPTADALQDEVMASVQESVQETEEGPGTAVDGFLRGLGLRLRREWLDSCVLELGAAVGGFERMDVSGKAKLCFERFLVSDMNVCGGGVLPENVQGLHNVELRGPFVLQVDEMANISSSLRDRYNDAPAGFKRCLKLSLTDGAQHVYGMEYRPVTELKVLAPAGFKVAICNVQIRCGLLMLVPEVVKVLGGLVETLELARQRLVHEITKPPRGRRKQPVMSLSERASHAAWPSSTTNSAVQNNGSASLGAYHSQPNPQAGIGVQGIAVEEVSDIHTRGPAVEEFISPITTDSARFAAPCVRSSTNDNFVASNIRGSTPENPSIPITGRRHTNNSSVTLNVGSSAGDFATPVEEPLVPTVKRNTVEEPDFTNSRPDTEPSHSSCYEAENFNNVDEGECPIILRGENGFPFTYFASLLTKWAAEANAQSIQGCIKCFFTGVKGFQFKNRSTFELCVYVDDGSRVCEVIVDHHFVQKTIGYPPEVVTAALSSSDMKVVLDMKEAMKKFQTFLANFEGTMLVEMNECLPHPIARELRQGCSVSDGWLLLRRLKTLTAQTTECHLPSPIELSP